MRKLPDMSGEADNYSAVVKQPQAFSDHIGPDRDCPVLGDSDYKFKGVKQ
jgi:hypothetical protein